MNFHTNETFTLESPFNISKYDPSLGMKSFYAVMFIILETMGNFLLFCMIIYEKYGMDSQKRNVANQLLSSICFSRIIHNIIVIPFFTMERIFLYHLSKNEHKVLGKNCTIF